MEYELISSVRYMGILPMIILALLLALRNRGKVRSAVYNRSRNLLIVASLLLAVHFVIQFLGHYREQSPTLCWTLNLLFFVTVTPLYNMAELNLLRAGHNMKERYLSNVLFILLCYLLFGIGYLTGTLVNDAQPWMTVTCLVAVLYSLKLVELSWVLRKEMKVADARLTDEELTERHNALRYTARVMNWIIIASLGTPWVGMSSSLLLNALFGMVIFSLLIWFLLRFLNYGENMAECIEVNDEIMEAALKETAPQTDDNHQELQRRIEQWVAKRRYTDPSITIAEALEEMGVSAAALTFYLETHTQVEGYRQWLPHLRIEEAKRIMKEPPEYSFDHVAEACGYSNGGNMSRAFKLHEGMPPSEWLARHGKG